MSVSVPYLKLFFDLIFYWLSGKKVYSLSTILEIVIKQLLCNQGNKRSQQTLINNTDKVFTF